MGAWRTRLDALTRRETRGWRLEVHTIVGGLLVGLLVSSSPGSVTTTSQTASTIVRSGPSPAFCNQGSHKPGAVREPVQFISDNGAFFAAAFANDEVFHGVENNGTLVATLRFDVQRLFRNELDVVATLSTTAELGEEDDVNTINIRVGGRHCQVN